MKKVFLSLAVVAMFSFAACNGSAETTDTNAAAEETQIEEPAQEPVMDEAAADMAEDAPAEGETVVAE